MSKTILALVDPARIGLLLAWARLDLLEEKGRFDMKLLESGLDL